MQTLPPSDLIQIFREAGRVQRMHLVEHHWDYSIARHSWNALNLILFLHPEPPVRLLKAVQFHDVHERFLGDVPSPAKWNRQALGAALKLAENDVDEQLGVQPILDALTDEDRMWLIGVDVIELMLWTSEQLEAGNRQCWTTHQNTRQWVKDNYHSLPRQLQLFVHSHRNSARVAELNRDGEVQIGHLSNSRHLCPDDANPGELVDIYHSTVR